MEEMNEIMYNIEKENQKVIDFHKEQDKYIEGIKKLIKELKSVNIKILVEKSEYYDNDKYEDFYYTLINKYFVLLSIIKDKNVFEKFHSTIISEMDNLQHYLHMLSIPNKTEIVLQFMVKFNELYQSIENYDDFEINDCYLYYEKTYEIINDSIFLYLNVNVKDKSNEFNNWFYSIKNIFQNKIIDKYYFDVNSMRKNKYFYILYFKYYLQEKYPLLDSYQYVDLELYKWNSYIFNDISIIYLYFHCKIIKNKYNTKKIEIELNKMKILYQNFIH
jgi:hypothetical protein